VAALLIWYLQRAEVKHAFGGLSAWPRTVQMLVLTVFTTLLAFPFIWMGIATFKQNIDLYAMENNPFLFNLPPTLEHLRFLFQQSDFGLVILLVEFCVSTFILWSLWKFPPKRLFLASLLLLTLSSTLFPFKLSGFSLTLFFLLVIGLVVSLLSYLATLKASVRPLLFSFLIVDVVGSAVALFIYSLNQTGFVRWLGNTTLVGIIVVGITLV